MGPAERDHEDPLVPAAGGVVVRRAPRGLEIVVVHRPKYDDWSLPKGKLDPGELFEAAALREIAEETGLRCRRLRELSPVRYRDAAGRPKLVRYWLMEAREGTIGQRVPDAEIDEVRWVDLEEARTLLSYERDRALLDEVDDG
jgi:8-oxo-dGTP diphosphatase